MGYSTLKAALDAVVKTNGRQQITGSNLNGVMTQILQGVDVMNRANPADTSGMNKVVLDKSKTFAEQVTGNNTIFEIRDVFDLGGVSVTIPTGSIVKFVGGSVNNGTIVANGAYINAGRVKIFGDELSISGMFSNEYSFPEWWGAKGDGVTDDRVSIQRAIDCPAFFGLSLAQVTYKIVSVNSAYPGYSVGLVVDNAKRICGINTKRTTGSSCCISFDSSITFDAGIVIDTAGVFMSNISLLGANTYNVDRMVSTSLDGTKRQELKFENIKVEYAKNGFHLLTYLSVLSSIRIQNVLENAYTIGDTHTRYPTNELDGCYALDVNGIAFNLVNYSTSILKKCYAERCGFVSGTTATDANTYPAYNISGARGVSLISCGSEACAKPLNISGGEAVTISGCSFHAFIGSFATLSGDLSQFVLTGTLKGFSAFSCNFIGYADQLISIGESVVNVSFDSCCCYTSNNPLYKSMSKENLSRFDQLTMSISANRTLSIYDNDAISHSPAENKEGSLTNDLAGYSDRYDFFGKKLSLQGGTQLSTNINRTISNYRGSLTLEYPAATSENRAVFYGNLNIVNCKEIVIKNMYTEMSTATHFIFTDSVVVFDGCYMVFTTGRAAFFTLQNCTLIFKNCTFSHPERAPQDFLLSALDLTSTIIIEDATGKYLTKDGKRGIRSVTTAERPASAPVGEAYYDETIAKPIWYTGSGWVDATGASV